MAFQCHRPPAHLPFVLPDKNQQSVNAAPNLPETLILPAGERTTFRRRWVTARFQGMESDMA